MSNDPVIPECYTSRLPFPTDGQVIGCVEVLSQEVQRVNGFLAFQFGNVDQESRIVKQRFNLRDWVSSDLASISLAVRNRVRRTYQGMLAADWPTEWSSAPVDRVYKDVLKRCVSKKKRSRRKQQKVNPTSELCTPWRPSNSFWKVGLSLSKSAV
jgi:hypothetical protein